MAVGTSRLTCPQCRAELRPKDVDFARLKATCRACGLVLGDGGRGPYRLGRAAPDPDPEETEGPPAVSSLSLRVPRPSHVEVDETTLLGGRRRLTVTVNHLRSSTIVVLYFGVMLAVAGLTRIGEPLALAFLVIAGGLLVGGGLDLLVSKVRIQITDGGGVVREFSRMPGDWGRRALAARDIEQLWVEERPGRQDPTYMLQLRHGGATTTLLAVKKDLQVPFYLEELIERFLGVEDEPVPGQVER